MEACKIDPQIAKKEKAEEEMVQQEQEAYEEAMEQFRLSPAYPYIMKLIDEKIAAVTDTRILARSFGRIKAEVVAELGTLGMASLMASMPLEELKQELS